MSVKLEKNGKNTMSFENGIGHLDNAKKIERMKFVVGERFNHEYHLSITPAADGGVMITWSIEAPGGQKMSFENGFTGNFHGDGGKKGLEISIAEILDFG